MLHRKNAPAVIYSNGTKEWYEFDFLHRDKDLPAIVYSNGDVEYWNCGRRHRSDGPAVICGNKKCWFVKGELIKCQ